MSNDKIIFFDDEPEKVFKNWFTLSFKSESIHDKYEKNRIYYNKTLIIIYLVLQTIILFGGLILFFKSSFTEFHVDYL